MQKIKAIINNHNMNILHKNNEIKDERNWKNKKYCPVGGKCDFLPTQLYQSKFTKSNPLHMKITQMTQTCRNNTGTLKGATLFQK